MEIKEVTFEEFKRPVTTNKSMAMYKYRLSISPQFAKEESKLEDNRSDYYK